MFNRHNFVMAGALVIGALFLATGFATCSVKEAEVVVPTPPVPVPGVGLVPEEGS